MPGEQSVLVGFVMALVLGAIGFVASIALTLGAINLWPSWIHSDWPFVLIFGVMIMVIAGLVTITRERTALRQGLIIGFSVVFLLNAACAGFLIGR
jgi:hypothetical protein